MDIRNVAIIAHVDHGKTTLVDCLLKQSGTFRDNQQVAERAMDLNDLERERGITILAKATSVEWKGTRINIVDTPRPRRLRRRGRAHPVDGRRRGPAGRRGRRPLPQTKFVLGKALRLGLKPIVLINKVDRSDARAHEVHDEVFDLFSALEASDEQLDFPTLFASARQGWAATSLEAEHKDMDPLFDLLLNHVPAPKVDPDPAFRMLVTTLEADNFLGRILTGRILSGSIKPNTMVKALSRDGKELEQTRITRVLAFRGLERVALESAEAGDIVAVAGLKVATVADTIGDLTITEPIASQPVDPPTLAMTFMVNDPPLAGTEGDKVTTRMIRARLMREGEGNVAIRVTDTENADSYEVAGRGELQLGVLIETMRREGFELAVGRPRVLFQTDPGHRPAPGADRGSRDRRRRRLHRPRRRADLAAQGRAAGHAPVGRRQDPPRVLRPVARPDRLSRRVPDRHARHRRDEPPVPRIRRLSRADRRPPQRRADRQRRGQRGDVRDVEPRGSRPDVHRPGRARLSWAW